MNLLSVFHNSTMFSKTAQNSVICSLNPVTWILKVVSGDMGTWYVSVLVSISVSFSIFCFLAPTKKKKKKLNLNSSQ